MPVELSITKASIRQHLTQVDFDSLDSLRSFASLLNDSCSRDIANTCVLASSLTLSETFRFFGYTNEIRTIYGAEKPIICEELIANVPANVTASKSFSRLSMPVIICPSLVSLTSTSRITGNSRESLEYQRRNGPPPLPREGRYYGTSTGAS